MSNETTPRCMVCGRILKDEESIAAGISPKYRKLGWTPEQFTEHMAAMQINEEDYAAAIERGDLVRFSEIYKEVKLAGISPGRLMKATGGDRSTGGFLSPMWEVKYHKGRKYLSVQVRDHFDVLQELGRKPKAEKPEKELTEDGETDPPKKRRRRKKKEEVADPIAELNIPENADDILADALSEELGVQTEE